MKPQEFFPGSHPQIARSEEMVSIPPLRSTIPRAAPAAAGLDAYGTHSDDTRDLDMSVQ